MFAGCNPRLSLSLQAVAGLLADARSLADVAREEASSFRSNYGHDIPLKVCDDTQIQFTSLHHYQISVPPGILRFFKMFFSVTHRLLFDSGLTDVKEMRR